jgi:hypothetical protein
LESWRWPGFRVMMLTGSVADVAAEALEAVAEPWAVAPAMVAGQPSVRMAAPVLVLAVAAPWSVRRAVQGLSDLGVVRTQPLVELPLMPQALDEPRQGQAA